MPLESTTIIPAEQFFIPQAEYAYKDNNTVQQPPLLKGNYEVSTAPFYIEDTRPNVTMRGAVRQVDGSVGRVILNKTTHQPIGVVGNQYVPIQNKTVRNAAWKAMVQQIPAQVLANVTQTEYVENNGAFYRADWNVPDYNGRIRQKDGSVATLSLHVITVNPHGYSSDKTLICAMDDSCENIIPLEEIAHSETRRTQGFDPALRTSRAMDDIKHFANRVDELRGYAQIALSVEEFERLLRRSQFSQTQIDRMADQFIADADIRGMNVWNAVATLTAWSTHNELCTVRNSGNVDNEMQSLTKRLYRVSKVIASRAFSEVLA